jgi:hypothetical protein
MWVCFILILWIILFHIITEDNIQHIREHFAGEKTYLRASYPWKFGDTAFNYNEAGNRCKQDNPQGCNQIGLIWYANCGEGYDTSNLQCTKSNSTNTNVQVNTNIPFDITNDTSNNNVASHNPYDYQLEQLNTNYNSIDSLNQTLSTKERELQLLNYKADTLNRTAYVLKYVTIISISILVLMICIFVLNFDDLRGPSALAKQKFRNLFRKTKM